MTITPTPEQHAIIDLAKAGEDLVIEAGAGSGKTSTLRMLAAAKPLDHGLYVAYNKAIQTDAAGSFRRNVTCRTAHSLAFQAFGRQYKHRLNAPRVPARETARMLGIKTPKRIGERLILPRVLGRLVMETIGRFCHSDASRISLVHVPTVPGLETNGAIELANIVKPIAQEAWDDDLIQKDGRLRFTHDMYLKLWQLSSPQLGYDFLMLDEAQDANPVIADVVANQGNTQKILVGDQSQAIYGWRGAVDAMQYFRGARLQLSQSFRFGPAVADEANKWLTVLGASLKLTGFDRINSRLEPLQRPAAVLCRSNGQTIVEAMLALELGQRPAIVGGGAPIRRLAEAAQQLRAGIGTDHPELCAFRNWQEVQEYVDEDTAGSDLKVLVRIIDKHTPEAVIKLVDRLTADEADADVVISTAHKAKGREWATVRIADDFTAPGPDDDIDIAEAMLAYVAVTRAQEVLDRSGLAWVDGWV